MKSYIFGFPAYDVTRDLFFNVGDGYGILRWLILALYTAAFIYLFCSLRKRALRWTHGKVGVLPGLSMRRIRRVFSELIGHKKIMRDKQSGFSHLLVVWGVAGTVLLFAVVFIQEYIFIPFVGVRFIKGYFYIAWSFAGDLFLLMIIAGIALSLFRRAVLRPSSLITTHNDYALIILFVSGALTGVAHSAVRIAISGYPAFEGSAFISYAVSFLVPSFSESTLYHIHSILWWAQAGISVFFIAYAGSSTLLGHMTIAAANIYYSPMEDEPSLRYRLPLCSGVDGDPHQGISTIQDFSWKDLMDIDACMRCGRCEDRCPVSITGDSLSPQTLMKDLLLLKVQSDETGNISDGDISNRIKREDMMSCTQCAACVDICPARINQMKKIYGIRKAYTAKSLVPDGVKFLQNNCGIDNDDTLKEKSEWFSPIDGIRTFSESPSEYLFFAGCAVSRDSDAAHEARTFLSLALKSGASIGVLGSEESCCGDALLRAGDEKSFKKTAEKNIAVFAKYNVTNIVVACPHGYNVLNKEYRTLARMTGSFNPDYRLIHYSDFLFDCISKGSLRPVHSSGAVAAYHDPCFLGRYNEGYSSPRAVMDAVPGTVRIEMTRSGKESFCCGGPLAMMKTGGDKMALFRARDINSSGARVAVTACSHCSSMLKKGIDSAGIKNLRVCGIASYLAESVGV